MNSYQSLRLSAEDIRRGVHRRAVGGMWEHKGRLQFDFAMKQGLGPLRTLLDIGCGPLRAGLHFVGHLESGHYFGIDNNQSLLDAGRFELEAAGLAGKVPAQNLLCDDNFRFERFAQPFDLALAHSLFTHLPLNHIRHCLIQLSKCMIPGGRLFATFYECPDDQPIEAPLRRPNGRVTYIDRDFYHYRRGDLEWCADAQSWAFRYIGEWGHPNGQRMFTLTRL